MGGTAGNALLCEKKVFLLHAFLLQEIRPHAGEIEKAQVSTKLPEKLRKNIHSPASEGILHPPGVATSSDGRAQKGSARSRI